ncbi:hypothetical protein EOE67_09775 [Rheinheimera riviphila]|uniref:Uncharacterized protein n=1 Tax=Rheinheimera riviphila TaxID=1834037 RepID=A0A437QSK5_9GAMM|nr:hypothetical protein [Rheinheimera riviphila]RVU37470.1 hypothetical protein EOE67_09775 [Rheinheimera riviphila]
MIDQSPRFCRRLSLIVLFHVVGLSLAACSSPPTLAPADAATAAGSEATLPTIVVESSGLVCQADGTFLTINDSGNNATVYQLNASGEVLAHYAMDAANKDWEALTVHQGELWIGDIGNNSGVRNGGDLYRAALNLSSDRLNPTGKTSFVYPDLPLPPLQVYQHDFDAEALVSTSEQLLLFNKAWQSAHSTVYQLTPYTSTGSTKAVKIATVAGLPGVITGGAFNSEHQLFVLTGYARFRDNVLNMALYNDYRPFLAVLDRQFKLQKVIPVPQGGQLEAICIDRQQQIWLTQEKSKHRPALLWRWGNIQQLKQQITGKSSQFK